MKQLLIKTLRPHPRPFVFDYGMLLLRVAASLEIAIVHGFKKKGGINYRLVAQPHLVNIWKVLGVLLVITGVIIVRKS